MVYSTRLFVLCLTLCHFVLVFFRPFSIAITSLREERANLSAFRTFVRFVLVWICRFSLPLGVWEELRFEIVALPGLFSNPFFFLKHISITYIHRRNTFLGLSGCPFCLLFSVCFFLSLGSNKHRRVHKKNSKSRNNTHTRNLSNALDKLMG